MPAARYDAVIEQGATFRRVVEYHQPDGSAYDLTGWTAHLEVRRARYPRELVTSITSGQGDAIILDNDSGEVTVTLAAQFTTVMPPGRYVYTLDLRSPTTEVVRILRGTVTVRRR